MSRQLFRWLAKAIIDAYIDDRETAGLKPKTLRFYRYHLERAADWLHAQPGFHALGLLDPDAMYAYYRATRHDLANTTRRYMVNCFSAWSKWLQRKHGYPLDVTAHLEKPPPDRGALPKVLNPTDLDRLLLVIDDEPPRERALVLLFLDAGLRVSEVANLKRCDLDLQAGQLTVRDGKGNKDRVVFFFDRTARALADYLASHDHPAVFVSQRRGQEPAPLTRNGIRQILRRLAKRHGFEAGLQPHTLRRTCGTELAANNVDLSTIADQLGHSDVATTRIYTRLADERRREVLRRASPVQHHTNNGIPVPNWPKTNH